MSRFLISGFLILVLLTNAYPASTQEEKEQQEYATQVAVDTVLEEPLQQTVPVIGRLVATRAGVVAARTNGPVGTFDVKVGDAVTEGDTIVTLVSDALVARQQLWTAEVQQAAAAVRTSQARLDLAWQELDRLQGLEGSSAFSPARVEDATQEVAVANSELAESQAALQVAKSELMLAEINLYNAKVRAPYDGTVSQRHTEVGAFVSAGDPVVSLIDDSTLELEADVPSKRVTGLIPGTRLTFTWADGRRGTAAVRAVVPDENPLTRTRLVRFTSELSNAHALAVNQSVTFDIPSAAPRTVLSVHKDAVINNGQGNVVFVARDGKAVRTMVQLGESVGNRFEVLSGLALNDMVVIRGNERLRPDQAIQFGAPES